MKRAALAACSLARSCSSRCSWLPPIRQNAGSSYTVTETVETIEYDIVEPGYQNNYAPQSTILGEYGPFRVVAPYKVEMYGTVDSYTPQLFSANDAPAFRVSSASK